MYQHGFGQSGFFLALTLAVVAAAGTAPADVRACGGTFCDGAQGVPVDQTGENILFVSDATTLEAHIQIQYDPNTDADAFAWLIPLTSVPEFRLVPNLSFRRSYGRRCRPTDSVIIFVATPMTGMALPSNSTAARIRHRTLNFKMSWEPMRSPY